MFTSLVEKFLFNNAQMSLRPLKINSTQAGGTILETTSGPLQGLLVFLVVLAAFFIKVLLVMISYNVVVPRILDSWGVNMSRFRNLMFVEAIFLVILFNLLFTRM